MNIEVSKEICDKFLNIYYDELSKNLFDAVKNHKESSDNKIKLFYGLLQKIS